MRTNTKTRKNVDTTARLAGGMGPYAAAQEPEALLRRAVLASLLWEDMAYESGESNADNIAALVPQVDPATVAAIAVEARNDQKLRHVPLFLAREMARHKTHRGLVGDLLPRVIQRADEITEFLALYWKEGREPLANQVRVGLGKAFLKFDEYQFAKYSRKADITLSDAIRLVHPVAASDAQSALFSRIRHNELATPDTWEVALSRGDSKKETWERLIHEGKLGAMAFLRNLRNMESARVDEDTIRLGFASVNPRWLLPLNYLAASRACPRWLREIEDLMLRGLAQAPELPGRTHIIIDVSGSMNAGLSTKSDFSRLDAAQAMAILASEMCESAIVWATAGADSSRTHKTKFLPPYRGFGLAKEIGDARKDVGAGGIFTRQCLEYIGSHTQGEADRIIVISDSQDCDHPDKRTPRPFGKTNYIIDISSHARGVNYAGAWTAEISGWSEHFLKYIVALEGLATGQTEDAE